MEVLPDVLQAGLKVVFCGTAVGTTSAGVQAYYADRNNRFWETLEKVALTANKLYYSEYLTLPTYAVGLTDMIRSQFGTDKQIDFSLVDIAACRAELVGKINKYKPEALAFNGKCPAKLLLDRKVKEFGPQLEQIGQTAIFVLPSTSGMNGWWERHNHLEHWRELADFVSR